MVKPDIAGPRRARPAAAPGPIAGAPAEAPSHPVPAQVVAAAPPSATAAPKAGAPRKRPSRGRWFALGAIVGAVAALVARGEAKATLLDLRHWSARELRRLEHKPPTSMIAQPVVVAAVVAPASQPVAGSDCPHAGAPAPGDPCAELLAPFARPQPLAVNDLPLVRVEDLPRVHPPPVARRHHARHGVAPVAPAADADADLDEEQATPGPDDAVRPGRARSMEQTAENDARW